MWEKVRCDFEAALRSRLYENLYDSRMYREFLYLAGLRISRELRLETLIEVQRKDYEAQVCIEANKTIGTIRNKVALDEATVTFQHLEGKRRLFRAASSDNFDRDSRIWWFSEEMWVECLESGSEDEDRVHWLHDKLAVCYDWSRCDQIVMVEIQKGETVPAILGTGLPMPYYSSPGIRTVMLPGITHHTTIHGGLEGGRTQIVLPFIPKNAHGIRRFSIRKVKPPISGR